LLSKGRSGCHKVEMVDKGLLVTIYYRLAISRLCLVRPEEVPSTPECSYRSSLYPANS
jgi:hypothetical protein